MTGQCFPVILFTALCMAPLTCRAIARGISRESESRASPSEMARVDEVAGEIVRKVRAIRNI